MEWEITLRCPAGHPTTGKVTTYGRIEVTPECPACNRPQPKPTKFQQWREARKFRKLLQQDQVSWFKREGPPAGEQGAG